MCVQLSVGKQSLWSKSIRLFFGRDCSCTLTGFRIEGIVHCTVQHALSLNTRFCLNSFQTQSLKFEPRMPQSELCGDFSSRSLKCHIWANQSIFFLFRFFLVQSQKKNHIECMSIFEITYSAGVVVHLLVLQSGSFLIVGRLLPGNQLKAVRFTFNNLSTDLRGIVNLTAQSNAVSYVTVTIRLRHPSHSLFLILPMPFEESSFTYLCFHLSFFVMHIKLHRYIALSSLHIILHCI